MMNPVSFNFVKPTGMDDLERLASLTALKQRIEGAKETLLTGADAFVTTTPEDKSAIVTDMKTPQGYMRGLVREGKDGSLDVEVETRQPQTGPTELKLHRDANAPHILVMSEVGAFGTERGFEVNELSGMATPFSRRVDQDDSPSTTQFNLLHPKTLGDVTGAAGYQELRKEVDDARAAISSHPTPLSKEATATDQSVVVKGVHTPRGRLDGVHRIGQDGSEDLCARITESGGHSLSSHLTLRRDADNPGILHVSKVNAFGRQKSYTLNEATGEVKFQENKCEPPEYNAKGPFNFLHPKTMADVDGLTEYKTVTNDIDAAKAVLARHSEPLAKQVTDTDTSTVVAGVPTDKGRLSGVHRVGKDGSEDFSARIRREEKGNGYSQMVSTHLDVHRDAANPSLLSVTHVNDYGRQTSYTVNEKTGEVTVQSKNTQPPEYNDRGPFNLLHPKTMADVDGLTEYKSILNDIDAAKALVAGHSKPVAQQVTDTDTSLVVADVRTDKGTLNGVLRVGKDGSEDFSARIRREEKGNGYSQMVSTFLDVHRDAANPSLVSVSHINDYGTQRSYAVDEQSGQVTVQSKNIRPPEYDDRGPFNFLHPKTLADADGVIELSKDQAKLEDFRKSFSIFSGQSLTPPDQGVTLNEARTESGSLSGIHRGSGKDEYLEASLWHHENGAKRVKLSGSRLEVAGSYGGTAYDINSETGDVQRSRLKE